MPAPEDTHTIVRRNDRTELLDGGRLQEAVRVTGMLPLNVAYPA